MDLMILNRLPTQEELDQDHIELESFIDSFQANHVHGFIARIKDRGDSVDLDGFNITKGDWFSVVKN